MIELENLTMSYAVDGQMVDVLCGIDLSIDAAESIAVIGPSGSGKTTLLLLLAGLEQARHGAIRLEGASLSEMDADALADLRRDRVGIIFQSFHLIPSLTALGNVALPLEIAGLPASRELAARLPDQVGLAHRFEQVGHHLVLQRAQGVLVVGGAENHCGRVLRLVQLRRDLQAADTGHVDVEQYRRGWCVVIPDVVFHELVMPDTLAGCGVKRNQARAV